MTKQVFLIAGLLLSCSSTFAQHSIYVSGETKSKPEEVIIVERSTAVPKQVSQPIPAKTTLPGVRIGDTTDHVVKNTSWGRPEKINEHINAYGKREQWVYGSNYLYFHNGVLTSIQLAK